MTTAERKTEVINKLNNATNNVAAGERHLQEWRPAVLRFEGQLQLLIEMEQEEAAGQKAKDAEPVEPEVAPTEPVAVDSAVA